MRFGIHSNSNRDVGYRVAVALGNILYERGITPVFRETVSDTILANIPGVEFGGFDNCDFIVSIGGDGTFLGVVSDYRELGIPYIGINKGSIGFLTEIAENAIDDGVDRLIEGKYKIVERMQLKAELYDKCGRLKGSDICLNDVAVLRGNKPHIVKLGLMIDGKHVERFYGDGLVVATPTGSTAYTLAAGGPLLMPEMQAMLITPLCSHTLQTTSYVIGPDSTVEVELGSFETVPIISPDGHDFVNVEENDVLRIIRHEQNIRTVQLGYTGFFQNVRRKIIQRGSFYENSQE